jgi:hypothetical protein
MLHVDIPSRAQMERLLRDRRAGSVSLYVPTTPISSGASANRIDLKTAIDEALGQLRDADFDKRQLAALEEQLAGVLDDEEWQFQAHTLAVFATPERAVTFRLGNRVARTVEVSDRFHASPLFRVAAFPQVALVLALAAGSVRLIEIEPDLPAEVVRVADLPKDAASAVGKASIKDRSPSGRIQGSEGQKVRLTQYARAVARAIAPIVAAADVPLILAATQPLASIYRSVDASEHLAARGIDGNPEALGESELGTLARDVLDAIYADQLDELRDLFEARRGDGRGSSDVATVARAATIGAVDTLLVDMDETVPGIIDEQTGAILVGTPDDAHDYGVLDEIARRTYLNGGRVVAVRRPDIPEGAQLAAILRYAV